jgi:hypothetical protein
MVIEGVLTVGTVADPVSLPKTAAVAPPEVFAVQTTLSPLDMAVAGRNVTWMEFGVAPESMPSNVTATLVTAVLVMVSHPLFWYTTVCNDPEVPILTVSVTAPVVVGSAAITVEVLSTMIIAESAAVLPVNTVIVKTVPPELVW